MGRHDLRVAVGQGIDDLGEVLPAHALHGEVRRAVRPQAEIVDRHDGRVLELPLDPRLADEARHRGGLGAGPGAHHLHRHLAADEVVAAQTHFAHAATAEEGPISVALLEGRGLEAGDRVGVHGKRSR
jgi:hypothetical protein